MRQDLDRPPGQQQRASSIVGRAGSVEEARERGAVGLGFRVLAVLHVVAGLSWLTVCSAAYAKTGQFASGIGGAVLLAGLALASGLWTWRGSRRALWLVMVYHLGVVGLTYFALTQDRASERVGQRQALKAESLPASETFAEFAAFTGTSNWAPKVEPAVRYGLQDGVWRAVYSTRATPRLAISARSSTVQTSLWSFDLEFDPPEGESLTVGVYKNALQGSSGLPQQPKFYLRGPGIRHCGSGVGRFEVKELTVGPFDQLERVHVSFRLNCERDGEVISGEVAVSTNPWR